MKYENIENLDPRICISGKVRLIGRLTANIFRKYLSPFEITSSQLSILFVVSKHEQGINQKGITDILRIEKSSLNRNLTRLYSKKYLIKSELNTITLTDLGAQNLDKIIPEWQKAMDEISGILGTDGVNALNLIKTKF